MQGQGIRGQPVKDMYGLSDPSLVGGNKLIYDSFIPFTIRYMDFSQQVKQFSQEQDIRIRMLRKGTETETGSLRIQLQNSNDLFFNWEFNCTPNLFQEIKIRQNLSTSFQQFSTVLIKSFNRLHTDKGKYVGLMTIYSYSKLNLCVVQCSQYKNIEIFNLDFSACSDDVVHPSIGYRYQKLERQVKLAENRLQLIYQIIQEKNPSLLLELQKVKSKR